MYEEEKSLKSEEARRKRINRLKKTIVTLILTLMAVTTVLCIVLMIRVFSLQNKVDDLLEFSYKEEVTVADSNISVEGQKPSEETTTNEPSTEETTSGETTTEPPTDIQPLPDGKYAYLTFDDGPSANTMAILDILDQYGVKATFFVNGHTGETMEERYKAIVDRGHAIGIHTYTHKYEIVYGGLDKFEEEIVSLRDYIYQVTGTDTTLFRFPGGSSNSIVDDIYPYMQWLTDNGYEYWDWNSSSGDASGSKVSAQQIVENSMIQAKEGYKNLVILMHDTKSKDTTVEALPTLIEELQAYGYEIRAIDERSTPVQHRKLQ